ncbi:YsnF/AvaK domain-containing protein [Hymenobacter sp. J193]|uniref:YsnF/AvaK domain-containing protein n=1 Tax=Hymenobacter sp. J193 TaxID=2898429 RepID=UPI0021517D21|nr:YsnF/AvaK domain-containing protein [Hymenobacter sp. J193]
MNPTSSSASSETPDRLSTEQAAAVVLPVIEERAILTREVMESGRVQIIKRVHEQEEQLNVLLQQENVQVERRPVNQFVADDAELPVSRQEGDTTIIPVLREVVVTRVLVVEEIRITKQVVQVPHTQTVQLRQEEIQIERQSFLSDDAATSQPTH